VTYTSGGIAGFPHQTATGNDPDAVFKIRLQTNGGLITKCRVASQLRVVKVKFKHGPAYDLQDRNGDGRPDDDEVLPMYFKFFWRQ
jgi:hypothetical protein